MNSTVVATPVTRTTHEDDKNVQLLKSSFFSRFLPESAILEIDAVSPTFTSGK